MSSSFVLIFPASKIHDKRQKCGLKLRKSTNTGTGSQLVSRLFDIAPSKTGTVSDKGILGLLSSPSTNVASYKIQFERDKNTSLLSPVRGRRYVYYHYENHILNILHLIG